MTRGPMLLAFDFDGTLAETRSNPNDVEMHRAAFALLNELSQREGMTLAVVSGRDAEDLATRVPLEGVYLVASHGLEVRDPGGAVVRETAPLPVRLPESIRSEFESAGGRIEEKRHGVALHWRGIPWSEIADTVESFRRWVAVEDLELIEDRYVAEGRVRGAGKREALRWLVSAVGASKLIFAGDDLTDFDALTFAAERGRGVLVASEDREVPKGVTIVYSFRSLFRLVREEAKL